MSGQPFAVSIPDSEIENLRSRLDATRWPEAEPVDDWSQGIPLAFVQEMTQAWKTHDWRPVERQLNASGSCLVLLDGLRVHVLHRRSSHPSARPLLLTHGWPGSVIEFLDVLDALTEPEDPSEAFHVVIPALPGYGFSDKPSRPGWTLERIARAWVQLMGELGYPRFFAQGGDWGAEITAHLVQEHADACRGGHLNLVAAKPPAEVMAEPTELEAKALMAAQGFRKRGMGYFQIQMTQPQTLAYGLVDSPAGLAAWLLEKYFAWSERQLSPRGQNRVLDILTQYWLTRTAGSSARLYWESGRSSGRLKVEQPIGCTVFPKEIQRPSRRWAESRFKSIRYWSEAPRGGHFAALEEPELFVREVRACFAAFEL